MIKGDPFPKFDGKAAETKHMIVPISAFLSGHEVQCSDQKEMANSSLPDFTRTPPAEITNYSAEKLYALSPSLVDLPTYCAEMSSLSPTLLRRAKVP